MVNKPDKNRSSNIAILYGDHYSMKYFAQRWSKNKAVPKEKNLKGDNLGFIKGENGFTICLVPQKIIKLKKLPEGNIVWLVPERGPSIHEVADFRLFLEYLDITNKQLRIVVCLPYDQSKKEADETIDEITNMALPAVPHNVEAIVESVWLSQDGNNYTVDMWFKDRICENLKHD